MEQKEKRLALLIGIVALITAIFALATEGVKFLREVPPSASPTNLPSVTQSIIEPTGANPRTLVFGTDFEDESIANFTVDWGKWSIVDDGTDSMVLESDAGMAGSALTFISPEVSDFVIEYKVKLKRYVGQSVNNDGYSLQFRKGPQTYYVLFFGQDDGGVMSFSYVSDAGYQWDYLTGTPYRLDSDSWYKVKVSAEKGEIKAYVNGVLYLTATDSRLKHGLVGFDVSKDTLYQFDDIQISISP